jgi:hypothetical protein
MPLDADGFFDAIVGLRPHPEFFARGKYSASRAAVSAVI